MYRFIERTRPATDDDRSAPVSTRQRFPPFRYQIIKTTPPPRPVRNRGSGNTVAVLLGNGAGVGRRGCYLRVPRSPPPPPEPLRTRTRRSRATATHCDGHPIAYVSVVCARAHFSSVFRLVRRRRRRHRHRLEEITTVSPPPYPVRVPPSAATFRTCRLVRARRFLRPNRRRLGNDDPLRIRFSREQRPFVEQYFRHDANHLGERLSTGLAQIQVSPVHAQDV